MVRSNCSRRSSTAPHRRWSNICASTPTSIRFGRTNASKSSSPPPNKGLGSPRQVRRKLRRRQAALSLPEFVPDLGQQLDLGRAACSFLPRADDARRPADHQEDDEGQDHEVQDHGYELAPAEGRRSRRFQRRVIVKAALVAGGYWPQQNEVAGEV